MADITINDLAGNLLESLESTDETTVGELLAMLGAGVLKKDGVLWAKATLVLAPGTYTLGPPIHQQQQQQQQQRWYKVSGTMSRPTSHAGARYELFKLASSGGLYPPGLNAGTAFETEAISQIDRSILKFSLVFETWTRAASFVDGIKMYLCRNDGDLELLDDQGSKTDDLVISEIPPL